MAHPASTTSLSRAGLLVIAATTLISVMNSSMSSIVLPDMRRAFDVGPDALSWVVTAYLIPFATGMVIFGRLADIHGSKRLYLLGMAIFSAAAIAIATAPSFEVVVGMRAVQGLGGAAVPALGVATILRFSPASERGTAMGVLVLAVGVGFAIGPIAGGWLTDIAGWEGPFLLTGVGGLVLLPLALKWVPGFPGTSRDPLDWQGGLLLAGSVTGFVIALNRLPRESNDPLGLLGLAFGLPLLILLAVRMATARHPFIPPQLLKRGRFPQMSMLGFMSQATHFGVIVLLPLLMEELHQLRIVEIGLRLLPGALALGFFGVLGGWLTARIGERVLLIAGSWLMFSGVLVLHLTGVDFSTWNMGLVYLLVASGYGMVNAALLKAATDPLEESLAGVGAGVFNLCFFVGGAVSVAVAGAVLRAREGATEPWDPIFDGVAVAYSDAMVVVVAFAFVGFLISILQPPPKPAPEPEPDPANDWFILPEPETPPAPAPAFPAQPRAKGIVTGRPVPRSQGRHDAAPDDQRRRPD